MGVRIIRVLRSVIRPALLLAALAGPLGAEELPGIGRGDISVEPANRGLRGELRDQLRQYRQSLRSTGLAPRASRLAQGERQRMLQLLESRGYYDAEILYRLEETEDGERVRYRVDTGPRYRVLGVEVQGVEVDTPEDWPAAGRGEPLDAETILADQSRLRSIIDQQACYFQLNVEHEVRLAEDEAGGRVVYRVSAAQPSQLGEFHFSGNEGVSEAFLRRQTDLDSGACFSRAALDQAVLNLYQTQLFATVRRSLARDEDGRVDVTFDLVQRPARTLRSGIGWDTDQGLGLTLGWEHRNLAGRAQRLELGTSLQAERQSANVQVTLPGFLEARNTLTWNNTFSHETPEDEEYYIGESRATIDRQASRRDLYRYGLAYRRTDERVGDDWATYSLLRLPLAYEYDGNPGNFSPSEGQRYNLSLEPVWSLSGSSDPFWIAGLGWSGFQPLGDEDLIGAVRLGWTSLWPLTETADLDRIPASDRLLAGGGGSVRGYPYRSIGQDGSSDSGTQQWDATLELRGRLGENWGLVLFADSASVSEDWNPAGEQDWYSGAGLGARYYTRFAPIRLDLAWPLRQRDGDGDFQIYLSLGQSF